MNSRIERMDCTPVAWLDSDSRSGEILHRKSLREMVVDELIWWAKCFCVVGLVAAGGFVVGWLLAKL